MPPPQLLQIVLMISRMRSVTRRRHGIFSVTLGKYKPKFGGGAARSHEPAHTGKRCPHRRVLLFWGLCEAFQDRVSARIGLDER